MKRKLPGSPPSDWTSDLEAVRATGDRRASSALLDVFLTPETDEDRRAEIGVALRSLEDPRCAGPLRAAVLDPDLPSGLRSLALEVYAAIPVDVPARDEALAWSRSPDPVVRAFGTRALDVQDGESLAAAARDAEPLVRWCAADAIASIARTRPLVEAARRALADDDAAIREAGCRIALFDEPLDLTRDLLRALADESTAVRIAACDALEDYPRRSVLLALAEARGDGEAGLAAHLAFGGVVQRVKASFAEAGPRARRRLERWAEPVRWLLDDGSRAYEEAASAAADDDEPGEDLRLAFVDPHEAVAVLLDDDAPPARQRRLLCGCDWSRSGAHGLAIARECARSANWSLRQGATRAFADLNAGEDLVALAADREPVVRRAALEALRRIDERGGLAAARATLADPAMRGTAGDEALALLCTLGTRAESRRAVLDELERPDDRDGLWLGAIQLARLLEIEEALPHLARIAEGEIVASVLPHVAALCALRELGAGRVRAALDRLEPLDHLEVQRELGEWDWHGARFG